MLSQSTAALFGDVEAEVPITNSRSPGVSNKITEDYSQQLRTRLGLQSWITEVSRGGSTVPT